MVVVVAIDQNSKLGQCNSAGIGPFLNTILAETRYADTPIRRDADTFLPTPVAKLTDVLRADERANGVPILRRCARY